MTHLVLFIVTGNSAGD